MGGKLTAEKARNRDEKMQQVIRREEPTSAPPRVCALCGNQKNNGLMVMWFTLWCCYEWMHLHKAFSDSDKHFIAF